MRTIKDIHNTLSPSEKSKLAYAFDHEIAQIVDLPDGTFIGVHLEHVTNIKITQTAGAWSLGVKRSPNGEGSDGSV